MIAILPLDHTKLVLFFVASAALIITPGPAVLYVVTRGIAQGRTAGICSVLGVGLGNFMHAIAAALGLSAVLASSALAFSAVKYLGAIYLVYLGVRKFLSRSELPDETDVKRERLPVVFGHGFVVGTLNPKTALFFLAFLPQFVAPARGHVATQLFVLGTIVALMGVVSDTCYALLSGTFGSWLKRRKTFLRGEKYVSGTVYCGLGVATAFSGGGKSA
jgi:threonine/homoserine/homoserine lactone efflux protein